MTFASKKEADAYDKMLDMAEAFSDWLVTSNLALDEDQREALGMHLAENKDAVQHILRTSKMPEENRDADDGAAGKSNAKSDADTADQSDSKAESDADADTGAESEAATAEQGKRKPARAVKAA